MPDIPLPPYSYVPGGPWPHPTGSPEGHSAGRPPEVVEPIGNDDWWRSAAYLRGIALFNAGYYWEAHEAWEILWHAHGRKGPTADVLKALIKLAASGVKVRQRQPHGIITHARRAAALLESARMEGGTYQLGLNLEVWAERARRIAETPPDDPATPDAPVALVFDVLIAPSGSLNRAKDGGDVS